MSTTHQDPVKTSSSPKLPPSATSTTTNTSSKNPNQVTFSRLGWRNPAKHTEGLKSKENFCVSRNEDGASKIQSSLSFSNDQEEVKEMNLYVRRRFFPIMPVGLVNKVYDKQQKQEKETSDGETKKKAADDEVEKDPLSAPSEMLNVVASSCSFDEMEKHVAKDFGDVMNVILLDEPLPLVRKKEATVEAEQFSEYNLPPGSRVVGDRVFYPRPKGGLFGSNDDDDGECSLPLSFFKKKPDNGPGLFGQPQPAFGQPQPAFGQPQPAFGQPQPGLFGAAPSSGLFGSTNNNNNLFAPQPASGAFGGGASSLFGNSKPMPASGFSFDNNKPMAAATKSAKPSKPAKEPASTGGLFGSGAAKAVPVSTFFTQQQQQQQPSFTFGSGNGNAFGSTGGGFSF